MNRSSFIDFITFLADPLHTGRFVCPKLHNLASCIEKSVVKHLLKGPVEGHTAESRDRDRSIGGKNTSTSFDHEVCVLPLGFNCDPMDLSDTTYLSTIVVETPL